MLALRVMQFWNDSRPLLAFVAHESEQFEVFFQVPLLVQLGVNMVEPSFTAVFAAFVANMVSPEEQLPRNAAPFPYSRKFLLS